MVTEKLAFGANNDCSGVMLISLFE